MRYFAFLLAGMLLFFQGSHAKTPSPAQKPSPREICYGDKNAPVVMIEYSSFTCSVCNIFVRDILPFLQKEFIRKGKVFLITRDYPMNGVDLKATLILQASPNPSVLHESIFKSQDQWIHEKKPLKAIADIALKSGMTAEQINLALSDKKMQLLLTKIRQENEEKYNIDGLPVFIIGSKVISGLPPWRKLRKTLNQALVHVRSGKPLDTFGKN